jgi:putative transposase
MNQPESQAQEREPLPTIWEVTDAIWDNLLQPLLSELDPPRKMGRPRADQRRCLEGMIYRARTGCQWNQLPERFGSDSTVHRTVYRWDSKGIFDRLWALLIYHCEDLGSVHWEWQAADGCMNKARFIGKKGVKANRARHRKSGPNKSSSKASPKKTARKAKESAPIPPTVASRASSKACWSRSEAAHFLSASQARM